MKIKMIYNIVTAPECSNPEGSVSTPSVVYTNKIDTSVVA